MNIEEVEREAEVMAQAAEEPPAEVQEPIPADRKHVNTAAVAIRESNIVGAEHEYLSSTTIEGRYRIANMVINGGMVPKGYKTAGQVLAGMEFARELSLKPITGLRNIAVINGSPSIWGDLPLAMVRRAGLLDYFEEFIFDKDYKEIKFDNKNLGAAPFGAICRTRRKGSDRIVETWFTMDDAKTAGLTGRDNVWKTYPRRMLQMRARSQNLKDNFPDALMGIAITEYDYNYMPAPEDRGGSVEVNHNGTPRRDVAKELNAAVTQ